MRLPGVIFYRLLSKTFNGIMIFMNTQVYPIAHRAFNQPTTIVYFFERLPLLTNQ
jgi:hypothetical protein